MDTWSWGHHVSEPLVTLMDVRPLGFACSLLAFRHACRVRLPGWSCRGGRGVRWRISRLPPPRPVYRSDLWMSRGSQSNLSTLIYPLVHLHFNVFTPWQPSVTPLRTLGALLLKPLTTCLPNLSLLGTLRATLDPTHIFISCGFPQRSSRDQLQAWSQWGGQGRKVKGRTLNASISLP